MTLLSPGAAIAAAALSAPVLLLLYLLKLRRRPVRVGSILFWPTAREDVQANVPLRWVRPSWLLLLHALILAALVLAMGRPVISGGAPPGERIVLLLVTSASMSAVDEPGQPSRLDRARQRAIEVLDSLRRAGGRREVALVAFAAEAHLVTGFTTSRAALVDAINAVPATDQPASLSAALRLVDALSGAPADEAGESEPPTAVLISDGSFKDRPGHAGAPAQHRHRRPLRPPRPRRPCHRPPLR
jgi:Ca-activated chloride channel family protein